MVMQSKEGYPVISEVIIYVPGAVIEVHVLMLVAESTSGTAWVLKTRPGRRT
jgi:hypothetical protein